MKRGDFLWAGALAVICLLLVYPVTHAPFVAASKSSPFLMGFAKFAVLATLGELLALRIVSGGWKRPTGLALRAAVWGLLGVVIVLMFEVFASGLAAAISKGLLPAGTETTRAFVTAFWISAVMNLAFAPTFMALHRITDTYIDMADGELAGLSRVRLRQVIGAIDWYGFVSFVVLRTLPLFWIPAHTLTFLLPPEYRVLAAAFLSIALGAILAFAKRKPALKRVK